MATTNKGVAYTPAPVPADAASLPAFLGGELRAIAQAVQLLAAGHLEPSFLAPGRPRDGDIRLADGTHWDPGSGAGVYAYYGGSWKKLG